MPIEMPESVAWWVGLAGFGWWMIKAAVFLLLVWIAKYFLINRAKGQPTRQRVYFAALFALWCIVGTVVLIAEAPVEDTAKNTLVTVIGLGATAVVTLSSTTIAANFMAGLMLRQVRSFRAGDWIRVENEWGRVTERRLLHCEMQTEERDLLTLPNSYLISRPVRVVRSSGTVVTCEVSLGYDVPHGLVSSTLVEAAKSQGLTDPYVLVRDLLDHAVLYRLCGFLEDVKQLVSARSNLRIAALDSLHRAGIEIVSPNFVNQRRVEEPVLAVEEVGVRHPRNPTRPESVIFDKAEDAERMERLKLAREQSRQKILELTEELSSAKGEERERLKRELDHRKHLDAYLEGQIDRMSGEEKK